MLINFNTFYIGVIVVIILVMLYLCLDKYIKMTVKSELKNIKNKKNNKIKKLQYESEPVSESESVPVPDQDFKQNLKPDKNNQNSQSNQVCDIDSCIDPTELSNNDRLNINDIMQRDILDV